MPNISRVAPTHVYQYDKGNALGMVCHIRNVLMKDTVVMFCDILFNLS